LTRRDLLVAGAAALCTGLPAWWIGRQMSGARRSLGGDVAADKPRGAAESSAADPPAAPGSSEPRSSATHTGRSAAEISTLFVALRGRITYVAANGDARPDVGARVFALPETNSRNVRAASLGFLPGAAETDVRLAQETLRGLGGGYALADADGQYELLLPTAGTYQLLFVSRYAPADARRRPPAELSGLLETFFEQPQRLLGKTDYSLATFRCRGGDAELRDHVFQRT
jgi:hypothetical protein